MAELRALWWWIDRWRKSTAYTDMTLEEQGAYRNLLDEAQLRGGPLPTDERVLAKVCGDALAWDRVRVAVLKHFTLTPDGWRNETLDKVLAESARRAAKQRSYRQGRPAAPVPPKADKPAKAAVGHKLAFVGERFKVWAWQHDDLRRALGAKPFDLVAWYPKLDAEMVKSGEPIADEKTWLTHRLYAAAGIARPNLLREPERNNVPDADESAKRRAALRASAN